MGEKGLSSSDSDDFGGSRAACLTLRLASGFVVSWHYPSRGKSEGQANHEICNTAVGLTSSSHSLFTFHATRLFKTWGAGVRHSFTKRAAHWPSRMYLPSSLRESYVYTRTRFRLPPTNVTAYPLPPYLPSLPSFPCSFVWCCPLGRGGR